MASIKASHHNASGAAASQHTLYHETPRPHPDPAVGPTGASSPRLVVLQVSEEAGVKRIRALETRVHSELWIELRGHWEATVIGATHVIRVILVSREGRYERWRTAEHVGRVVVVDNDRNLLIMHPDTLLSGTTVADSFRCIRKSVLGARTPMALEGGSIGGEAALFGSMIHDLFQNVLVLDSNSRDYSTAYELTQDGGPDVMSFFEAAEDVVHRHADALFAAAIPLPHARKVLHKVVPQVHQWYRELMGSGNFTQTQGVLVPHGGKALANVIVTKVHDIEELVWSPALGLKGKIDASVHLRVNGEDRGIAVLELKSGKAAGYTASSHSAQVSLYNLLLSDRMGGRVSDGLLTYIRYQRALQSVRDDEERERAETGAVNGSGAGRVKLAESRGKFEDDLVHRLVPTMRCELVGLIMQRNSVAAHMRSEVDIEDLPPLLYKQKETCERCFASDSCMLQHRMLENGSEASVQTGPGEELFRRKAGHLTSEHAEYYRFWRNVLADEEEHSTRDGRSVWTKRGRVKEGTGRCASDLRLVVGNGTTATQQHSDDHNGLVQETASGLEQYTQDNENGVDVSPHALLPPGATTVAEFRRARTRPDGRTLLQCGLTPGDYVIVSAERRKWKSERDERAHALEGCETWQVALTNGFVTHVSKTSISISVDRSLAAWARHQRVDAADITWRVDGEETAVSHVIAKRTLETLFMSDESKPGMRRRRELIVDGVAPTFASTGEAIAGLSLSQQGSQNGQSQSLSQSKSRSQVQPQSASVAPKQKPATQASSLSKSLREARRKRAAGYTVSVGEKKSGNGRDAGSDGAKTEAEIIGALNDEQQRAVRMSFEARDYLLILGMPGTGKTATLAAIVATHALRGRSVLLCSHTNMAVDNLLLRLEGLGFRDFVRLGRNLGVIDGALHKYHVSAVVENAKRDGGDWASVEREVEARRVVATTALGIGHWVLQRRKTFDLVVVDEASQVMQPICIGPLLFAARAFVLVGDHYQLPPLQRAGVGVGRRLTRLDRDAQLTTLNPISTNPADNPRLAAEESLFRRLCSRHPRALVTLARQYRMAYPIMALCNELVYGGAMRCGDHAVGMRSVRSRWTRGARHADWLEFVRDPAQRVVMVDTQQHAAAAKSVATSGSTVVSSEWSTSLVSDATSGSNGNGHTAHQATGFHPKRRKTDDGVKDNDNDKDALLVNHRPEDGAKEMAHKEREVLNSLECAIVKRCVQQLVDDGVDPASITVLSSFRAQVDLLRAAVADLAVVSTVDQYQGRDNDCVFVSMVRCGKTGVGHLLRDWRRINVAMTRAKRKLVFVGCAHTLSHGGSHFLEHLVRYLSSANAVIRYDDNSNPNNNINCGR